MTLRVSDYIAQPLADWDVEHVFLLTGGGAMFLNDSFAGESRIQPICSNHEQACAVPAEGYARVAWKPAVINVTTGPGGINALNGVFGAWTDSVPLLVISGQVKRETCLASYNLPGLRQLGNQEADIVRMVKVFVLNNGGYLSTRTTQDSFFGRGIGEGPESGISFPDVVKLATTYGLPSRRIGPEGCYEAIREAIAEDGPIVCEVMLDAKQRFDPRLSSRRLPDGPMVSAPLEDVFPCLDREEFKSNLLIPLAEG